LKSLEEFLAYAVRLEREAAARFDELADAIAGQGSSEVTAFFRQMAVYSRRHLQDAQARSGYRDVPVIDGADFDWPDGESPEAAAIWASDGFSSLEDAMAVALDAEQRGHAFYASVVASATDPELRAVAAEFAEEEADHVAQLERLMARLKAA